MRRFILTVIACCAVSVQMVAREGFAIVIDSKSYDEAKTEVSAYAEAIERVNNLKVYTVIDKWGVPDSIRAELKRLHGQKQEPIIGAVFIGDIPVPMIRDGQHMTSAFKMNQKNERKESSIPSDRFYDDFGLQFNYLDKDNDAPYFYYSVTPESRQKVQPDLYSGRIRPTDAGGTSRYDKLRAFLRKAVEQKNATRQLKQLFFFSGHGYISESKVARMDEKASYYEHFPQLKNNRYSISYIDHSDQNPVKERLMNEVMRTDLDLAIMHHHGYWDTEYLNGMIKPRSVREAKEFIIQNCREHIYAAKEKGKNADSLRIQLQKKFDLPETWLKDALNDSLAIADSIYEAASDLHLEDFAVYNYRPNAPVVIIDACFCGSFHQDDCIANEYIFQPGTTVAVVANTVNALQDKWSDRLIGLLTEGGCVGDLAKYSTYLESHVIGDPTYRFQSVDGLDADHLIHQDKVATWKKLLKKGKPELQVLAIEHLVRQQAISSTELLHIYNTSPYGIVRLQALLGASYYRDDNFVKLVQLASQDSFELVQRLAVRFIASSGDDRLIPSLISLSIANNTSDRCNFDAMMALSVYPKDKLLAEFAAQFDNPSVQYIRKDSIRKVIQKAIETSVDRFISDVDEALKPDAKVKARKFTIRSMRNTLPHYKVPELIDFFGTVDDEETQLMLLECLGWHRYSCQADRIADAAKQISQDNKYSQKVREEALKTYNRINAR